MFRLGNRYVEFTDSGGAYLLGCLYDFEGDGTELALTRRIEQRGEGEARPMPDGWRGLALDAGEAATIHAALDARARREGREPDAERPRENA